MKSRKLSRRDFLRLASATAGGAVMVACAAPVPTEQAPQVAAPKAATKVTVQFWGEQWTKETFAELVKEFNAQSPDVSVEPMNVPSTQEKLITAVSGGTPPDLFFMDRYIAAEWAARGLIAPLDDYIAKSTVKPENLYPKLRQDVTWQGKIVALPLWTDCRAFYYNKKLLSGAGLDPEKPPKTWEELETMADKITKKDAAGRLDMVGFTPTWGNPTTFMQWWVYLWQLGGEYLSEDQSKAIFNSDAGVKALEWCLQWVDKLGGIEQIDAFAQQAVPVTGADIFTMGRLGMMINGNWIIPPYKRVAPDLEYGVATFPLPPNGQWANYIGGWTFTIPKGAKNPAASFKFIEFMLSREVQLRVVEYYGGIPAFQPVAMSEDYYKQAPLNKFWAEEVLHGRWVPVTPGVSEMFAVMGRMWDGALHKADTPKDALDKAVSEVQTILDKNRPQREGKS